MPESVALSRGHQAANLSITSTGKFPRQRDDRLDVKDGSCTPQDGDMGTVVVKGIEGSDGTCVRVRTFLDNSRGLRGPNSSYSRRNSSASPSWTHRGACGRTFRCPNVLLPSREL